MKKFILPLFLLTFTFNIQAQRFNHSLGLSYSQFSGTYGNMDMAGIQYNPQFQRTKGNYTYGLAFPMTYNAVVSSARSETRSMFELPVSFEMSFTPCGLCSSYQNMSIFGGAGISKLFSNIEGQADNKFINATIGIRVPVTKKSLELRLNYSRGMYNADLNRLGIGLGVTL